MTRAADSVGANIAESYGRFNFGLKASVSLLLVRKHFETKYWLNRTRTRGLMEPEVVDGYVNHLTELAQKLMPSPADFRQSGLNKNQNPHPYVSNRQII